LSISWCGGLQAKLQARQQLHKIVIRNTQDPIRILSNARGLESIPWWYLRVAFCYDGDSWVAICVISTLRFKDLESRDNRPHCPTRAARTAGPTTDVDGVLMVRHAPLATISLGLSSESPAFGLGLNPPSPSQKTVFRVLPQPRRFPGSDVSPLHA